MSGSVSRGPVHRCKTRQFLMCPMPCSTGIRLLDCCLRCCFHFVTVSPSASFAGLGGCTAICSGWLLPRPRYPLSAKMRTCGYWSSRSVIPACLIAVWSCILPGTVATAHNGRACSSVITVVLMVFARAFPDTNRFRPALCTGGRRTLISVPSRRNVIPSVWA